MTKQQAKQQKKKSKPAKRAPLQKRRSSAPATFGPVSTISTAPVAIGNSIRGAEPRVTMTVDGARVAGRDFAFTVSATPATVTGWTLVGAMPLTPSVMPSTSLKSYAQMYARFKINSIVAHYITSSATSQTGDIMFHFERDREGPFIDWSNNSFLPYTLSDPHTVIGPQWTNHTCVITPVGDWKYTDFGVHADVNVESYGSLALFSKTSSANSPGYVLLDYDISFKELQVNPRAGLLPVARGQSFNTCLNVTTLVSTAGSTTFVPSMNVGKDITGATSTVPTGWTVGDVYRCVFDVTNSIIVNAAWTNATTANLLNYETPGGNDSAVTIDDGFTCYLVASSATTGRLFPSLASALGSGNGFTMGVTATVTANVCCSISLVYSINSQLQAAY